MSTLGCENDFQEGRWYPFQYLHSINALELYIQPELLKLLL